MQVLQLGALLTVLAASVSATATINFVNKCPKQIQLYDDHSTIPLDSGANYMRHLPNGFIGMFRSGKDDRATRAEFSVDGKGIPWYDISIIAIGSGWCKSAEECNRVGTGSGFNVGMRITPRINGKADNCMDVTCDSANCKGSAYMHPTDDSNTHTCPAGTTFDVIFCPNNTPVAAATTTPTPTTNKTTTPTPTTTAPAANASTAVEQPSNESKDLNVTTTEATVGTVAPQNEEPVVEVKAKNAATDSSNSTTIVMLVLLAVGVAAGVAVIVVVRRKQAQLDDLNDKSPVSIISHRALSSAVL